MAWSERWAATRRLTFTTPTRLAAPSMNAENSQDRSPEAQLALVHSPRACREALRIFLDLDARLARIVSGTSEPMLGQMRLAWWRDTLRAPVGNRPRGDAVLDRITEHWTGREEALVALVDGWENMLAETLDEEAASGFADGRAAALAASTGERGEATRDAARRWALVDAAVHLPEGGERDILLELAAKVPEPRRLPRSARGIAVLGALAARSLARGGRPLMEGRGAALTAIRTAMIGR